MLNKAVPLSIALLSLVLTSTQPVLAAKTISSSGQITYSEHTQPSRHYTVISRAPVTFYPPQLDSLQGHQVTGRLAVSFNRGMATNKHENSASQRLYGVIWFSALIESNMLAGTTRLYDMIIQQTNLPGSASDRANYLAQINTALQQKTLMVNLNQFANTMPEGVHQLISNQSDVSIWYRPFGNLWGNGPVVMLNNLDAGQGNTLDQTTRIVWSDSTINHDHIGSSGYHKITGNKQRGTVSYSSSHAQNDLDSGVYRNAPSPQSIDSNSVRSAQRVYAGKDGNVYYYDKSQGWQLIQSNGQLKNIEPTANAGVEQDRLIRNRRQ
ncbi:hypothetical protein [Pragia fontium]|uniref:Uncharacterized protein n=1 Tax=Pragia fontium DSM 5563 = ATCC 49100 TaxID=1122977 RepID=A0AAJ5BGG9_9GAMM|nr:hypothetical protein [Pragia fontium]SFC42279.1 hypothetical protein SAMN02745723_102322 [Pragia fontium DSM 5563 = ATCC 49100]